MAYLHCPHCDGTAWLDSTTDPALVCVHCETPLTPMPAGYARRLIRALRQRFEDDARLDSAHPRFVRD
jgi:hypothetical protein